MLATKRVSYVACHSDSRCTVVFYVGAGYGEYYIVWEDIDGNWAKVSDYSCSGVALDLGAVFSWRWLAVSAGVNALDFKKLSFTCGVGVSF